MPGRVGFTMLDYSSEKGSIGFATGEITAVSLPGTLTAIGTMRGAIEGITLGVVANERLQVFDTQLDNTPPTNELAQVESAWLVQYEDVTAFFDDPVNAIPNEGYQKLFTVTIPTADIVGRLVAGTDTANLANTQIAAFVTAFEALARSPYGGAVNVTKITFVGRNR